MLKHLGSVLVALVLAAVLPACSLLPGTGPNSDAVNSNATAGLRSSAVLPYALVDVTPDTIGFLSQPDLVSFKGAFPDKRPKPIQVIGVGDVLDIRFSRPRRAACSRRRRPLAHDLAISFNCRRRPLIKRATFMCPSRRRSRGSANNPGHPDDDCGQAAQPGHRTPGGCQPGAAAFQHCQRPGRREHAGRAGAQQRR